MDDKNTKTIDFIDSYSGRKFRLSGSALDQSIIGAIEKAGGSWEPHVTKLLHQLIRPYDVCLDIGANIGVHSLVMANLASNGRVYAFEPSSINFAYLKKNLLDNQITNITALQLGLSNVAGRKPFYTFVDIPGASFASDIANDRDVDAAVRDGLGYQFPLISETVEFSTLDEWLTRRKIETVRLIKMDVEGSEAFLVEGGESFLRREKPILLSELNVKTLKHYFDITPEDYFKRLSDIYDYIYLIDDCGGLKLVYDFTEVSATLTASRYWADILCSSSEILPEALDPTLSVETSQNASLARFSVRPASICADRQSAEIVVREQSAAKIKLLYFTVVPLASLNNGGTLCCRNHVKQLAIDPQVDLTVVTTGPDEWADGHQKLVRSLGCKGIHLPFQYSPKGMQILPDVLLFPQEKWAHENSNVNERLISVARDLAPDVIVIDYLPSAIYAKLIFDLPIPRVVITLNREAEFFRDQRRLGQIPGPQLYSWIGNIRLALWEHWVHRHCNGVVALTPADLPTGLPKSVICEAMTPVFDRRTVQWSHIGNKHVFFVGNIIHYPNRMAMEWICTRLAVETEKLDREIRFRLIGADADEVPESWRRPSVEFLGRADKEEVTRQFTTSALFIAPISNNFGSKMKLLECLSHATPFLATVPAMSGLPFLEGLSTIDLAQPAIAAKQIAEMLSDPKTLMSLSRSNEDKTSHFRMTQQGAWGRYLSRVIVAANKG